MSESNADQERRKMIHQHARLWERKMREENREDLLPDWWVATVNNSEPWSLYVEIILNPSNVTAARMFADWLRENDFHERANVEDDYATAVETIDETQRYQNLSRPEFEHLIFPGMTERDGEQK